MTIACWLVSGTEIDGLGVKTAVLSIGAVAGWVCVGAEAVGVVGVRWMAAFVVLAVAEDCLFAAAAWLVST